ncbi:MAG: hypothetical protein WBL44_14890 [Nitrososphaeraceae archaeon]
MEDQVSSPLTSELYDTVGILMIPTMGLTIQTTDLEDSRYWAHMISKILEEDRKELAMNQYSFFAGYQIRMWAMQFHS